ncbi:hypothetical protein C4568_03680 [Candidatus Parcubacteria bacterium]|nr:MAG: hypothetical protein C4568_03680 [Candidatus Parcubacteria bacterium]
MNLIRIKDNLYVPEDFEKNHNYFADPEGKKKYTGITTILNVLAKPALIGWAARMVCEHIRANCEYIAHTFADRDGDYYLVSPSELDEAQKAHTKKKEEAGAHGTDAHALVEEYINVCLNQGGQPQERNELLLYVDAPTDIRSIKPFTTWAVKNVDHFLFSERRMANPELFIAGTADFAYVGKDGRRYMADFKTSSGIYGIDYWLQVAAYRLLAEAEGDEPYDGATIVRLGKDGSFEVQHRFDYETDKKAFLACLEIYRAQQTYVRPARR